MNEKFFSSILTVNTGASARLRTNDIDQVRMTEKVSRNTRKRLLVIYNAIDGQDYSLAMGFYFLVIILFSKYLTSFGDRCLKKEIVLSVV